MPFGTHRQRVPAMLAVACAGMLVYTVAGAAPDGRQLAPATCSSEAGPPAPGCFETAAAKDSTPTTEKGGDKGSTPDKCESTTTTTRKGGDKDPTTTTTEKGGDKDPTTTTTEKGGDKDPTTTTTEKGGDKDPTTTTTEKGGDKGSTTTTGKNDSGDNKDDSGPTASKAAAPTTAMAVKGDAGTAAAKDSGDDTASKSATDDKDCSTTTTTEKGGKGDGGDKDTTTTTRKGGGKATTTTTEKDSKGTDKPTTSTTTQGGTVEPQTPGDSGSSDGSTDPGSGDQGDNPISPQEAPPYDAPDSDPGPAADPEAAADPGPVDDGFDMWDDEEEVAISPMEAPGSGSMLPVINDFMPSSGGNGSARRERSRPTGSAPRVHELAAPPVVTLRGTAPTPGTTESAAVSRRLAGQLQTSVTESAFPANIISTPGEFPVNHRDPLAAAALVVLVGVSRELFKVWRRRATDFWPA